MRSRKGAKRLSPSALLKSIARLGHASHWAAEQHVPASFHRLFPGFSPAVTESSLVCIPVFSDSDTTRLTAKLSTAKITLPVVTFKVKPSFTNPVLAL